MSCLVYTSVWGKCCNHISQRCFSSLKKRPALFHRTLLRVKTADRLNHATCRQSTPAPGCSPVEDGSLLRNSVAQIFISSLPPFCCTIRGYCAAEWRSMDQGVIGLLFSHTSTTCRVETCMAHKSCFSPKASKRHITTVFSVNLIIVLILAAYIAKEQCGRCC